MHISSLPVSVVASPASLRAPDVQFEEAVERSNDAHTGKYIVFD